MKFTAAVLAEFLKGKVEGNPMVEVDNFSKIEEGKPGTISFLANPKYISYVYSTNASIVIVNADFQPEQPITTTLIRVENAYEAFANLLELAQNQSIIKETGISPLAFISDSAQIGDNVYIAPFVYIGKNVKIADGVRIFPHSFIGNNTSLGKNTLILSGVHILHNCEIGENCIIQSGVVIGGDGFGFAQRPTKDYRKIPQLGNVIVEENVEIGANTTIDRATLGSTIIKKGAKLDNLIQIAHNVEIGENTVIAAQTGISGSAKIGRECVIGGQVGIAGHITITDEVKIQGQSGIANSIFEKGISMQGSPALPLRDYLRSYVGFKNLSDLEKKIDLLEKRLADLENK